jgi:hypothetical protein
MNKKSLISFVSCLLAIGGLWVAKGWTYEVAAHEGMTDAAFDLAYPDPQQLVQPLGIKPDQSFSELFSPRDGERRGAKHHHEGVCHGG